MAMSDMEDFLLSKEAAKGKYKNRKKRNIISGESRREATRGLGGLSEKGSVGKFGNDFVMVNSDGNAIHKSPGMSNYLPVHVKQQKPNFFHDKGKSSMSDLEEKLQHGKNTPVVSQHNYNGTKNVQPYKKKALEKYYHNIGSGTPVGGSKSTSGGYDINAENRAKAAARSADKVDVPHKNIVQKGITGGNTGSTPHSSTGNTPHVSTATMPKALKESFLSKHKGKLALGALLGTGALGAYEYNRRNK